MNNEIKKAIITVAGLGTRFLPLSRVVPKEFIPVVDKPLIQYIIEEAKKSGLTDIIFVVSPSQKAIMSFVKPAKQMEKVLASRKKEELLKELKDSEAIFEGLNIQFVIQREPKGDGHAVLQAAKFVHDEAVAVLFSDDLIDSDTPAIAQLCEIFKTCACPVLALAKKPVEDLKYYGVVKNEKIANRLYKIKKIVEKPGPGEAPSDMVIVGKYILTPEVFTYLKEAKPSKKGEIILAEVFDKMLSDGKIIYGYEVKGEWLECGDKRRWLKSFLHYALKDPRYGKELREYLK
ncbi:NTP transferase domain-containing protein [Patescibacteria group bacterium]|nr:NTP transferase domain-containing protein [Patescibacteria group bacterium]